MGAKPTFPISWTHGLNVFINEKFEFEPDIWGTVLGTALLFGSLVIIPFVDRGKEEPKNLKVVFDWRKRGYAYVSMAFFWLVFLVGVIQNWVAGPG